MPARSPHEYQYTLVPGHFLQSLTATDPATFNYTAENFGLITHEHYPNEGRQGPDDPDPDSKKAPWQRFARFLRALPATATPGTTYKLIYLGRHGEGYHN
ncbi:putative phosphoglycerate mutase pmu1, partial [Teratosphaeriaceae sp. CCFEE 6253]